VSDPVSYTAVLLLAEQTAQFVLGLLAAERRRWGTRGRRRALGCYQQAVLMLRWFLDGTTGSAARRPTGTCTRSSTPLAVRLTDAHGK
jgi:hypothetical protein